MQSKRTKALAIPESVKRAVYERDGGRCVLCSRFGEPNAHFIARSHGGLGIEENIVTLCPECHRRYDQTTDRKWIREYLQDYLVRQYPGWDVTKLIYKK